MDSLLILTLVIDVIFFMIILYPKKNVPFYFDLMLSIFILIFTLVGYSNDVVIITSYNTTTTTTTLSSGATETIVTQHPVYSTNPNAFFYAIGFVLFFASIFIVTVRAFASRKWWDLI